MPTQSKSCSTTVAIAFYRRTDANFARPFSVPDGIINRSIAVGVPKSSEGECASCASFFNSKWMLH